MKKSVKKVLAALLSVLLFASLFTTTAFAAHPVATDAQVASARKELNDAIVSLYNTPWVVNGDTGDITAGINLALLVTGKAITNGYTVLAYKAETAHVQAFQAKVEAAYQNIENNINAWLANFGLQLAD